MSDRQLMYRLYDLHTGRKLEADDHPLIDAFNEAKDRGLLADLRLSQLGEFLVHLLPVRRWWQGWRPVRWS